jgi:hypothetical protein
VFTLPLPVFVGTYCQYADRDYHLVRVRVVIVTLVMTSSIVTRIVNIMAPSSLAFNRKITRLNNYAL